MSFLLASGKVNHSLRLFFRSFQSFESEEYCVVTKRSHIFCLTFEPRLKVQTPSLGPRSPMTPPSSVVSRTAAAFWDSSFSTPPLGKSHTSGVQRDWTRRTSHSEEVGDARRRTGTQPAFWTGEVGGGTVLLEPVVIVLGRNRVLCDSDASAYLVTHGG